MNARCRRLLIDRSCRRLRRSPVSIGLLNTTALSKCAYGGIIWGAFKSDLQENDSSVLIRCVGMSHEQQQQQQSGCLPSDDGQYVMHRETEEGE